MASAPRARTGREAVTAKRQADRYGTRVTMEITTDGAGWQYRYFHDSAAMFRWAKRMGLYVNTGMDPPSAF